MKKRSISSNELIISSLLLVLIGAAMILMRFVTLGLVFYVSGILMFLTHFKRKRKTKKMNVPGHSILISKHELEVHVNGSAKGDICNFFEIVSESLVFGVENKLRITFYTWHLTPKYLKATLGKDITIINPGRYEKVAQLIFNRYYYKSLIKKKLKKKKINPLIKVVVNWDKVNPKALNKLKKRMKAA